MRDRMVLPVLTDATGLNHFRTLALYNGAMPAPILTTKLFVPPPRQRIVARPRLIERLDEGFSSGRKLTLVSAPAGFGKSALLSEWNEHIRLTAAQADKNKNRKVKDIPQIVWLSLDQADNDLVRFLSYLIAALQRIAPNIGAGALAALQSPQPPPTEALLVALLNEIAAIPHRFVLVLDDYHVIEAKPIDDALAFLLENMPPQMHLVIATREDPDLALARLRARGQLVELRAADLRFTRTEAADFFNRVMGLDLSANDIAALETRTEGWIAGLQLAALAIQGHLAQDTHERRDVTGFINAFAGSHRFVLDYLVGEVLERRPEEERRFLLQTSVLDRLCGPLCDAVTEQENGRETLETFEHNNLFVVPLDDQRRWYRYHHLFAEVLQARLMEKQPEQVRQLHQRAGAWYERNGLASDAIHHALAATDFERAADLIELQVRPMYYSGMEATWAGWVKQLPDEIVRVRPLLNVYYAMSLLPGDAAESGRRLSQAEYLLNLPAQALEQSQAQVTKASVANQKELQSVPGIIAIARAYCAGILGDESGIAKQARQALDVLPETDHWWRGAAAALLGIAYWNGGDLEAAHQTMTDAVRSLHLGGGLVFSISAKYLLADIRLAQGHLHDAIRICDQALELVAEQDEPAPQGTADLHVVLSEVYLEQNEPDLARQHLETYKELGPYAALVEPRHRWYCAMARLQEASGEPERALELLDEAERQYVGGPVLQIQPIPELRARVWLRQGRLNDALEWARGRTLAVSGEPGYAREFEYLTLVRILIAQSGNEQRKQSLDTAKAFLARLLQAAQDKTLLKSRIEIHILNALANHAQGNLPAAFASLESALTLAEAEGYVRIFTDEGPAMAELLRKLQTRETTQTVHGYIHRLLSAFDPSLSRARSSDSSALIEPLSERELAVLVLLRTELSGPEMARELFVSLNTLRTHIKNIYNKLDVNNRRAAVRRAEELGLL